MNWGAGRGVLLCIAASAAVACSFDTSNTPLSDDGGAGDIDGTVGRADAINPSDCPAPIKIDVQVNGLSAAPPSGQPYVRTLIGDSIQLSATGTCTQSGIINYSWAIEPGTTLVSATAAPNLSSEVISVYALQPESYTVRLRVSDGTGESLTRTIFAFETTGFTNLPGIPDSDVKDLSSGNDYLWLGGKQGAYRADLTIPGVYQDVGDIYNGSSPPSNIGAVHESADGTLVWFGSDDGDGTAYRLNLSQSEIVAIETIEGAKTKDIGDATTGVRYGTDVGVAVAADNQNFLLERGDSVDVVGFGSQGAYAGRDKLYPLPNDTAIDVFGGNNKIKGLADDGTLLWVAGDGKGVASLLGNVIQEIYTVANSELGSLAIRRLTRDSRGDIWAATQTGVSRFKQDRQIWVPMGANSGLGGLADLKSIAIDEKGGRRAVYAGSKDGLSVMRLSP